jgi:hypothetical protein
VPNYDKYEWNWLEHLEKESAEKPNREVAL